MVIQLFSSLPPYGLELPNIKYWIKEKIRSIYTAIPYHVILQYIKLYYITLQYTIEHNVMLYHTISYHIPPFHVIILYHILSISFNINVIIYWVNRIISYHNILCQSYHIIIYCANRIIS